MIVINYFSNAGLKMREVKSHSDSAKSFFKNLHDRRLLSHAYLLEIVRSCFRFKIDILREATSTGILNLVTINTRSVLDHHVLVRIYI